MQNYYVASITRESVTYPSEKYGFAPNIDYPEYKFKNNLSKENNDVYDMIREGFYRLGYDKENYNTINWNPLGEFIKPGNTVVIKPNWVMDYNPEPTLHDMNCLVTHPSVIRAVLDYVIIALNGLGKVIVADAPMTQCNLDNLFKKQNYNVLLDFYSKNRVEIEFIDMRGLIRPENTNKLQGDKAERNSYEDSVFVDVEKDSAFEELSENSLKKLRALKNDPNAILCNQKKGRHRYSIHKTILEADVIINLPKPKSHRKAGLTACAKNFVGVNVRKEYLPHANIRSYSDGGDAYNNKCLFYKLYYKLNDKYWYEKAKAYNPFSLRIAYSICRRIGEKICHEPFYDGSWYKNDTIWRTIVDLNKIVYYSDKYGKIKEDQQRKILNICDMVVSGEGEGPLSPLPKVESTIVIGESVCAVDEYICSFFGFNKGYVKYIDYIEKQENIFEDDIYIIEYDNIISIKK